MTQTLLNIVPLRAFADNYIWCLERPGCSRVVVVDPGDAAPVLQHLHSADLELEGILVTHCHQDHIGGIPRLLQQFPNADVYAAEQSRLPYLTQAVGEGSVVELAGPQLVFKVWEVPGHTAHHIAFLDEARLFCGDTLFANGCGRVFTGTFEQLADSLRRLGSLPEETQVYCAHEYTLDNIGFAKWVEPDNAALLQREQVALERVAHGKPTVPSTIGLELQTNPFMRLDQPAVVAAAEQHAGHALPGYRKVFRELREWKDREYD